MSRLVRFNNGRINVAAVEVSIVEYLEDSRTEIVTKSGEKRVVDHPVDEVVSQIEDSLETSAGENAFGLDVLTDDDGDEFDDDEDEDDLDDDDEDDEFEDEDDLFDVEDLVEGADDLGTVDGVVVAKKSYVEPLVTGSIPPGETLELSADLRVDLSVVSLWIGRSLSPPDVMILRSGVVENPGEAGQSERRIMQFDRSDRLRVRAGSLHDSVERRHEPVEYKLDVPIEAKAGAKYLFQLENKSKTKAMEVSIALGYTR